MSSKNVFVYLAIAGFCLAGLVGACSFSTANIKNAKLTTDKEGTQETTVFAQDQVFYCIVELANAPDDTKVKAVWTAVEVQGAAPDTLIDSAEKVMGDGTITFDLTNNQAWPTGKYKIDLYLNDKLDRTLDFQVQ